MAMRAAVAPGCEKERFGFCRGFHASIVHVAFCRIIPHQLPYPTADSRPVSHDQEGCGRLTEVYVVWCVACCVAPHGCDAKLGLQQWKCAINRACHTSLAHPPNNTPHALARH